MALDLQVPQVPLLELLLRPLLELPPLPLLELPLPLYHGPQLLR